MQPYQKWMSELLHLTLEELRADDQAALITSFRRNGALHGVTDGLASPVYGISGLIARSDATQERPATTQFPPPLTRTQFGTPS